MSYINSQIINTNIKIDKKVVIAIHYFITLLVILLAISLSTFAETEFAWQAQYTISFSLLLLFIWQLASWRIIRGTLFDPYAMFLVAAFLFNGGHSILQVFGQTDAIGGYLHGQFSDAAILHALAFTLPALSVFHLGGMWALTGTLTQMRIDRRKRSSHLDDSATRMVGLLLIALAIIPFILKWSHDLSLVLESGRKAYTSASVSRSQWAIEVIALYLLPGLLFTLAGSRRTPQIRLFLIALLILLSSFHLLLGQRFDAIMPLIMFAWVWDKRIQHLNRGIVFCGGITTVFFILPLIREMRRGGQIVDFSDTSRLWSSIGDVVSEPFLKVFSEFGRSLQTLLWTQQWVPSERDFEMGQTYIKALFSLIPNLFWDVHPALEGGSPRRWLTDMMPEAGHGFGYSFLAEAYLNFGLFGIIFLAVLGWAFGRVVVLSDRSASWTAVVAVFFTMSLVMVRGESLQVIRPLIWYSFLPLLAVFTVKSLHFNRTFH